MAATAIGGDERNLLETKIGIERIGYPTLRLVLNQDFIGLVAVLLKDKPSIKRIYIILEIIFNLLNKTKYWIS